MLLVFRFYVVRGLNFFFYGRSFNAISFETSLPIIFGLNEPLIHFFSQTSASNVLIHEMLLHTDHVFD